MLKRGITLSILGALVAALAGCAEMDQYLASAQNVGHSQGSVYQRQTEPYNGPRARVAVMDFQNKTATGINIGNGMKEQLVTALGQTGAFILLERDNLRDVMREQELGNSGRANPDTAAPIGAIEGADFLIYGAVTEYEADQAGADIGGQYQRPPQYGDNPLGAAAGAAFSQDHVAIDLRVVDSKTARIVATTTIQGRARDLAGAIDGQFSGVLLGTSGHYNTPIEKAVRACMIKAANWIADNTLKGGMVHVNEQQLDGPYSRRSDNRDNRDSRDSRDRDDRDRNGRDRRDGRNDGSDRRRNSPAPRVQAPPAVIENNVQIQNPAPSATPSRQPRRTMPQRPSLTAPAAAPDAAGRVPVSPRLQQRVVAPAAPAAAPQKPQAPAAAAGKMSVAVPEALVNARPGGGTVIGKVTQGQQVDVVGQQDGWTRVKMSNGLLGWVPSSAVK